MVSFGERRRSADKSVGERRSPIAHFFNAGNPIYFIAIILSLIKKLAPDIGREGVQLSLRFVSFISQRLAARNRLLDALGSGGVSAGSWQVAMQFQKSGPAHSVIQAHDCGQYTHSLRRCKSRWWDLVGSGGTSAAGARWYGRRRQIQTSGHSPTVPSS